VEAEIRFDLVGMRADHAREERIGNWSTRWTRDNSTAWRIVRWQAAAETVSRARREPIFVDGHRTKRLGKRNPTKLRCFAAWTTGARFLDGRPAAIDVYGNNGLAAGDIDGKRLR